MLQMDTSEPNMLRLNDTKTRQEGSGSLETDLGSGINETMVDQPDSFKYNVWVGCHDIPPFNGTYPRDAEDDDTVCTNERMENTVCYVGSDRYLKCTCTRVTWMNMTMPSCD